MPGRFNPFDPPDDFFRIRLITTMLETCGMFFNRGAAGKKLDYFLSFFQVSAAVNCLVVNPLTCCSTTSSPRDHFRWILSLASTMSFL